MNYWCLLNVLTSNVGDGHGLKHYVQCVCLFLCNYKQESTLPRRWFWIVDLPSGPSVDCGVSLQDAGGILHAHHWRHQLDPCDAGLSSPFLHPIHSPTRMPNSPTMFPQTVSWKTKQSVPLFQLILFYVFFPTIFQVGLWSSSYKSLDPTTSLPQLFKRIPFAFSFALAMILWWMTTWSLDADAQARQASSRMRYRDRRVAKEKEFAKDFAQTLENYGFERGLEDFLFWFLMITWS